MAQRCSVEGEPEKLTIMDEDVDELGLRMILCLPLVLLPLLVLVLISVSGIVCVVCGLGIEDGNEATAVVADGGYFKQLILEIYVDESGKALVTGYIEPDAVARLSFLNNSEYIYDNNTKQLYALTDELTDKSGADWTLRFSSCAYYTDYHTVFYLPDVIRLGRINCSPTMQYFVTVSNGSFVIDVHGYDVERPMTEIEYQEQLEQLGQPGRGDTNINTNITVMQPLLLLIIVPIAVLTALLVLYFYFYSVKKRGARRGVEEDKAGREGRKGTGIEISSDMMRVMETLTERERGIVNALLKHNGEMTQADLRYETGIPKSSLTGILRNLERRNIIKKKEWGRTNVIELSEWFLGDKGKK